MDPARRRTAALLLTLTVAGGCAAPPAAHGDGPPAMPDSVARTAPPSASPAPSTGAAPPAAAAAPRTAAPREETDSPEALAARARRDVDAILGGASPPIRWSSPDPAAAPAPGAVAQEEPTAAAEPFVPGPLFRTEDPPPTVEEPPVHEPTAAADPEGAAAPAPPTVARALETDRADELAIELARELYRRSSYDDVPLRELLVIAALGITDPDRDLSPEAIPGLTTRERETLEHFQSFCRRLGRELAGEGDADEVLVEALTALRNELVEPPRLGLPTAKLCFHVEGFGRFRAFDRNAFLAHNGQQVILYLEIDDFTSVLGESGTWVTELSQQLTIYSDSDGIPVWKADWQSAEDVSQNQRRDFFTVQVITLPDALGVGRYQLKARVRDEQSGAEAETAIEFEMVADQSLAAGME